MDPKTVARIKSEALYSTIVLIGYTTFIYVLFYFMGEPFRFNDLYAAWPVVLLVAYIFKTIFWIIGSIKP